MNFYRILVIRKIKITIIKSGMADWNIDVNPLIKSICIYLIVNLKNHCYIYNS